MYRMLHLSDLVGVEPRMNPTQVPEFISSLREAKAGAKLETAVTRMIGDIGFDTFVYRAMLPDGAGRYDVAIVSSLSPEWLERYDRMSYFEVDPGVQTCLRHSTPFLWDSTRSCGPRADAFLQDAATYGLRSGIALPIRSALGEKAMLGLNADRQRLPESEELELAIGRAYLFASYFHDWFFHSVRRRGSLFNGVVRPLSNRELEVLALAARGQSSKRIGRELGISATTATFHIESAKQKFGVRTRSEAVAHAVQSGLIR